MNNVLVSIITPAYLCKTTIKETYDSILHQSFSSWEWIVVEDNSPDDTYEYIKELVSNDKRVVLLRTQKNSGAATARNIGINKAKGRYIAFLDSDDLWKENKLERQIAFMSKNNYSFTYTNYDLLYASGKIKSFRPKKLLTNYKSLLKKCDIGCLTVVYDSFLLGKILMPIDCEKREDYGTWLDITRNGATAYKLDESLAIYRIGRDTVSSKKTKMIKFHYRVYRKHEKFGVLKSLFYLTMHIFNKIFTKY